MHFGPTRRFCNQETTGLEVRDLVESGWIVVKIRRQQDVKQSWEEELLGVMTGVLSLMQLSRWLTLDAGPNSQVRFPVPAKGLSPEQQ